MQGHDGSCVSSTIPAGISPLPPLCTSSAKVPSPESVNEKMEMLKKARPQNALSFHADGILLSGFNRIYR